MKKILLLGGSAQQVIAISTAKRMGFFTVLCDYLPDNPGREAADRFFLVSTTDRQAVLDVARREKIDGVLAYASDPAAPTAAYVAQEMGLPGNPYESVRILCNKEKFRAFLKENGFNTPNAKGYGSAREAFDDIRAGKFKFPLIAKPVDSSGSKGVVKIDGIKDALKALEYSMSFSKEGRIIAEEFVEKYGYQIAGDGLSVGGKLVFRYFADDHFDVGGADPFVPVAASFPCTMPEEVQDKIHSEIQRLLTLLGMGTCTYNFDVRADRDFNVFLMEVAPRSGGNYIPQIIKRAAGVDLVECAVKAAMGGAIEGDFDANPSGFYAYYAVHSGRDGILKEIRIDEDVQKKHVIESHIVRFPGDEVRRYTGSNTTLGILIMRFEDIKQMLYITDNPDKWITVGLH